MKRIVSVTAVFLCGISLLQAQPVRVSETLKELDMENISVVEKRDTITAAFETSASVLSLIHISEPTRHICLSRMPSSA